MSGAWRRLQRWVGAAMISLLPGETRAEAASALWRNHPQLVLEALAPGLQRQRMLDTMPVDLPTTDGALAFEHLAGLFSSTSFDHGVISMTIRQAAYLFGIIRRMQPGKVIEIGRYKGGSTVLIAAAMAGRGEFWSIDLGDKEARLHPDVPRPFDIQVADWCEQYGLRVHLLVGDSRRIEVDTGDVDVVLIDGDHSYEGVRSDFNRFGRRVRVGGAVLLDDAFDEPLFKTHSDTVGRVVADAVAEGEFGLVRVVNRLAHLQRLGGGPA